jgi:hypothetical protein
MAGRDDAILTMQIEVNTLRHELREARAQLAEERR